jgi:hypothetical protein
MDNTADTAGKPSAPELSIHTPFGRLYYSPENPVTEEQVRTKAMCRDLISEGKLFPSVTNVISMKSSPHLITWASRLIAEEAIKVEQKWPGKLTQNPSKAVSYLKETANRERDHWGTQGTNIHNAVEKIALGEKINIDNYSDYEKASIAEWVQWFKAVKPEFKAVEATCFGETSTGLKYAGTADFIATINEKTFVGDYKCVTATTPVTLANGSTVEAQNLLEGDDVVAWSEEKSLHISQVSYVGDNGVQPVIKLETDLGFALECTENHPVLVSKNGSSPEWVEAQNITVGDIAYTSLGWSLNPSASTEQWPLPNGLSPYVYGVLWALKNMRGSLDESSLIRLPRVTREEAKFELKDLGFKKAKQGMLSAGNALRKIARKAGWSTEQVVSSLTETVPMFVQSASLTDKQAFISGVSEIFSNPDKGKDVVYIVLKNRESLYSLTHLVISMGIIAKYGVDRNSGLQYVRIPKANLDTIFGYGMHPVKIVSHARLEPQKTVAIEVAGAHTHITSGLITHNTNRSGLHAEIALQLAAITNAKKISLDNQTLTEMPQVDGLLGVHISPKGVNVRKIKNQEDALKTFEALTQIWYYQMSIPDLTTATDESIFSEPLNDVSEY